MRNTEICSKKPAQFQIMLSEQWYSLAVTGDRSEYEQQVMNVIHIISTNTENYDIFCNIFEAQKSEPHVEKLCFL